MAETLMTKAKDNIRSAVLGADRPFRVIDGGGKSPPPDAGGSDNPCPITPLGDFDGVYHFLDSAGQKRQLSSRQLGNRHEVRGLFRGDEAWLRAEFPDRKDAEGEGGSKTTRVVGFNLNAAAAWLQKSCSDQGLYGDFLQLRRPGIWRGEDGMPVVHCGDGVLMEGDWRRAGLRTGMQIWIAAPPTPRPAMPCDHSVGQKLHDDIQALWNFKLPGGPALLIGLIATSMLGTAARWRPNAFLTGEGGSGKSMLLNVLKAACPMHAYTNNATEAGVMSVMNGRVQPIFVDESSDRANQGGADALMDLVLASAGGDGTKGVRGLADGKHRTIEMAGCILYGSVNPPSLLPQHLGRITLVELLKPEGGDDRTEVQQNLEAWAAEKGPALFGRVISSAERWHASLQSIRARLAEVGCAAREMDQMGALLAGWWILTREGLPQAAGAIEAVGLASEYIRPADEVADDSGPRRAIQHLLAQQIQYDGTTRHEQVGILITEAMANADDSADSQTGSRVLARFGLRPVRPCLRYFNWGIDLHDPRHDGSHRWYENPVPPDDAMRADCSCRNCRDRQSRPVPRLGLGGGLWLLPVAIKPLFRGVHGLDGDRWQTEILRLGTRSRTNLRVGGVVGKAIWLPREAIDDGG